MPINIQQLLSDPMLRQALSGGQRQQASYAISDDDQMASKLWMYGIVPIISDFQYAVLNKPIFKIGNRYYTTAPGTSAQRAQMAIEKITGGVNVKPAEQPAPLTTDPLLAPRNRPIGLADF